MKVLCFSSFTYAYLDRARVLFASLRRFHPDWELVALITDLPPPGFQLRLQDEPFDRVVHPDTLIPDFKSWLFKHDVVEVCTAVKGPFLLDACGSGADVVMYLDPDTALFSDLTPLIEQLERDDILLTPHLLVPNEDHQAIFDNDLATLRTGIFNLGFVAVKAGGEGARFAQWWNDRLLEYCYDDIPAGLFVDQKWCDHVPVFFDRVGIVRDPGYNVASWNLSQRKVAIGQDGAIRVNGAPLRFWHFTKLGPTGDVMTRRYAGDSHAVYEIWRWYKEQVDSARDPAIPDRYWAYEQYGDGTEIERAHRLLWRERADLRMTFPDPFDASKGGFLDWLRAQGLAARPAA